MSKLLDNPPYQVPDPNPDDVATLAWKFYLDGNRAEGHALENWLCAEYMLRQKQLIQVQVNALRGREHGKFGFLWDN